MNEATDKERQYAQELNDSQFAKIQEYAKKTGRLEIHNLSEAQIDQWRQAVSKIYPEFYSKKKIGEDLIKAALATK
jgi:C4-dicarboxylate-binding protein DctP